MATAIPRLGLLSRLGALALDQASFAKDYLGATPSGGGGGGGSKPRPSRARVSD